MRLRILAWSALLVHLAMVNVQAGSAAPSKDGPETIVRNALKDSPSWDVDPESTSDPMVIGWKLTEKFRCGDIVASPGDIVPLAIGSREGRTSGVFVLNKLYPFGNKAVLFGALADHNDHTVVYFLRLDDGTLVTGDQATLVPTVNPLTHVVTKLTATILKDSKTVGQKVWNKPWPPD